MGNLLRSLTIISLVGIFVLFGKNFSADKVNEEEKEVLKKELATTVPSPGNTVTLLTVLKKNLSGARTSGDPRTVNPEAIYAGGKKDSEALRKREFTSEEIQNAEKFFEKLVRHQKPKKMYEDSKALFGSDSAGQGAARWMTLGLVFDSSVTYGDALGLAMKDADTGADGIYSNLSKGLDKVRADPFFYQMAMNLVNQMDIDRDAKAQFFGGEIEHQLKNLTGEKTSNEFWISVMGMKLAQQSGLQTDDLADYLKRGLAKSKGSAKILGEVKETMTVYFPGMSL